ncbi:MAG TPA: TOPRIM nucleotidyl transferase/hydrolase domain-containing protein [Candidatus Dormibacteraeota bacterium]|nr:TOPRIM nucleotidyl transferase/hydrolase domain-containing protein [Candidatus Dormibacteraeota bacterium]
MDGVGQERSAEADPRTVVLVEGVSDQVAIETLAPRLGRDLDAEGVLVVAMGGATSIGRFLDLFGPGGLDLRLAGLCDAGEEGFLRRALERAGLGGGLTRAGMAALGFFVCDRDLEDELIRAVGAEAVERVLEAEGDLRAFRTLQHQPAQRGRAVERQLHRFMGSISGRKARYARGLVEELDLARIPEPLSKLLAHL